MESMMTARQVAELLGVHENWVYDQAASGALPSYKIGGTRRFDPDELRGWIAAHRQPDHRRGSSLRPAPKPATPANHRGRARAEGGRSTAAPPLRSGEEPQSRLFE